MRSLFTEIWLQGTACMLNHVAMSDMPQLDSNNIIDQTVYINDVSLVGLT